MKEKAEDENEDEDEGCRHARAPTPFYHLLRAEAQRRKG
jgi:hypothetical protein